MFQRADWSTCSCLLKDFQPSKHGDDPMLTQRQPQDHDANHDIGQLTSTQPIVDQSCVNEPTHQSDNPPQVCLSVSQLVSFASRVIFICVDFVYIQSLSLYLYLESLR